MALSGLRGHPFEVEAFLRRSLVLTYAAPATCLEHLLSPGLQLDTHDDFGFLAVAMVESEKLRPAFLPAAFGTSFFLTGFRLFVRYKTQAGKHLRGLRILRSETNRMRMVRLGNLFTHYNYHLVDVQTRVHDEHYDVLVSRDGGTTLDVTADLSTSSLPPSTIFQDEKDARRFAGPMPFTFGYEPDTQSIVRVEGVRTDWKPRLVDVDVRRAPSLAEFGLAEGTARFVSAFYLEDVPYRWKKGISERVL